MLLRKGLILVPMAILGITILGNTINANSITDTKDRIKEIKIVEEQNIDRLIRNKKVKLEVNVNYARSTTKVTSRGEDTRGKTTQTKNTNKVSKKTKNKETEKTEQKENYVESKNVKISKNMNLTVRTGLSKEEFKMVMKNLKQDTSKFFYNNADTIYDLCEKYQINEIFFCGLISAESGWNIAGNHRRTYNYISLMSNGKLIKYSSTKQGLEVAAQKLHNNYLTPGGKFYGGKTLYGVKKKFCPSETWVDLVYGRMSQVMTAVKKVK